MCRDLGGGQLAVPDPRVLQVADQIFPVRLSLPITSGLPASAIVIGPLVEVANPNAIQIERNRERALQIVRGDRDMLPGVERERGRRGT